MQVVHPVCCGIDGHAAQLTACLRRAGEDGTIHTEWRDFGTTYDQLLALRAWLDEQRCPIAVIESTGVYWKPISHVLVETLEVVVANARSVRQRPGKKTDKANAVWLAELLAHGLVEPSFIPPPAVQALRDLTRTRVAPRRLGAQHGVMARGRGSLADVTGAGAAARGRKGLWNSYPPLEFSGANGICGQCLRPPREDAIKR